MAARTLLLVASSLIAAQAADKVNVTLFSESLCPDCQDYIVCPFFLSSPLSSKARTLQ
jgi:hypothetical protein